MNHLFRPVFLLVCLCIPANASNFAIVVGIARYGDRLGLGSEGELWYAEKDAQELYAILLSKEGGAYPPENVRKLIGADATLAHLRDALETWLPAKASNPNDRVLIFFSGHGVLENGRGYVLPFDADRRDLPKSSYSMDDLRSVLRGRVKGRTKILLTDACHSGYVNTAAVSASKALTGLDDSIFSLAAAEGVSIEQPMPGMRHGVFGTFLLQGLKGWADSNCDGIVTAQELAYIYAGSCGEANRRTPEIHLPAEFPGTGHGAGAGGHGALPRGREPVRESAGRCYGSGSEQARSSGF